MLKADAHPHHGSLDRRQVVDGPLLHSKLGGAGYVDSQEKMDKIFQGVRGHVSPRSGLPAASPHVCAAPAAPCISRARGFCVCPQVKALL